MFDPDPLPRHFPTEESFDRWSAQHEPLYRCECGTDMEGHERQFVETDDGEVVMCRECAAKASQ